jgi:hypothetical protein
MSSEPTQNTVSERGERGCGSVVAMGKVRVPCYRPDGHLGRHEAAMRHIGYVALAWSTSAQEGPLTADSLTLAEQTRP